VHGLLGTKLNFSTAYYPQTDGQTERINQILEDMLRACALQYGTSWDKSLHMQSSHTTIVISIVCYSRYQNTFVGLTPARKLSNPKWESPKINSDWR